MSQVNGVPANKSIGLPLLTWKDPVKTGKVFGALIFALIVLKSVNLLSLFFRLGAYALFTSAIAEYAGKLATGTGFVTRLRPAYSNAFSSQASKFLESFANDLPNLEQEGQKLLYSFNIENTLKASALFYVLFKITSWIALYKLIFLSTVLGFSVPAVYEKYQDEINAAAIKYSHVAREKAVEYSKLAQEKAAPYIAKADEKLGPVSKFIKQKYQVRTASSTVAESSPAAFTTTSSTSASTSGAEVPSFATKKVQSNTTEFPTVPDTTPLTEQINKAAESIPSEVDVNDLKSDILKNKNAAIPSSFLDTMKSFDEVSSFSSRSRE